MDSGAERPDPLAPPEGYGQQPGEQQASDASASCSVELVSEHRLCGHPSVIRMTFADAQEHLVILGFCLAHLREVHTRKPYCQRCTDVLGRTEWMKIIRTEVLSPEADPAAAVQDALNRYFG